jgi:outer membrane protein TolC
MKTPLGALCGLLALSLLFPKNARAEAPPLESPASPGLALGQALAQALKHEPSFQVSRLEVPLSRLALNRERAAWDPRIGGRVDLTDERFPASTGLDGARVRKTDTRSTSVTLTKPFKQGGDLQLSANDNRRASNSTFTLLNPSFRSGLSVKLNKPLARTAGRDSTQRQLRQSRLDWKRAALSLREQVLNLLARTERAYWTLAANQEKQGVAKLSLNQARQLLEWNRSRVEAGALARIAVIEAQAAVAQREASLLGAELALENARIAMLEIVSPPVQPGSTVPALASLPGTLLPQLPDHEQILAQALQFNPSYRQVLLDLETSKIEVAFARDQLLPRVDLVASLELNGLGSNRENSFQQAFHANLPTYFVGLSWEVPLGRRGAHSELQRRRLRLKQALLQIKAIELKVESQVEAARRRYRLNVQTQEVTQRSLEAAQTKLNAERERYEEGMITADDLLRFQRELAEAHSRDVSARTQTSISAMEILQVAGTLPEQRGVTLAELGL